MKPEAVEHDPQRPVFEAIQQGDSHALAELMHRQGPWVRGVIFAVLGRADELDDVGPSRPPNRRDAMRIHHDGSTSMGRPLRRPNALSLVEIIASAYRNQDERKKQREQARHELAHASR